MISIGLGMLSWLADTLIDAVFFFKKRHFFLVLLDPFPKISWPIHHALAEETPVLRHGRNRRLFSVKICTTTAVVLY